MYLFLDSPLRLPLVSFGQLRLPEPGCMARRPVPLTVLSPRESQVLKAVVEGKTSKEIATEIGVSPTTIDTYRRRIMVKLDIENLPDLVRLSIRCGVIKA